MTDEDLARAREHDDGTLDVWMRGRRIRFHGPGKRPTVTDGEMPPPDAGSLPDTVLTDFSDAMATVSHDGWYVRISDSTVDVNRTRARLTGGRRHFFKGPWGR